MNNDLDKIFLTDEEGNEIEFNLVTELEIEGTKYVILSPEGEEDVNIAMKVTNEDDDNWELENVESDFELSMIEETLEILASEEE